MKQPPREPGRPPQSEAELARLDALAAKLERSASWFPRPIEPDASRVPDVSPLSDAPATSPSQPAQSAANDARPDASVAMAKPSKPRSARPLGKKERRALERKQRALAAERAIAQKRERRRQRKQERAERRRAPPAATEPVRVTTVRPALEERASSAGPGRTRPRRHIPWLSIAIAIALVPLTALLHGQGRAHNQPGPGWLVAVCAAALLVAWLLRKK